MASDLRSRLVTVWRQVANDQLYRGSLLLLTNTAVVSVLGFLFWTLAARRYQAADVGSFSGMTSGMSLLAAVAALGLPNTIIRRLADTRNQRQMIMVATAAIAAVGGVLSVVTVLLLGPVLPAALHLREHGGMVFVVTTLVILTAITTTFDAGLVAVRATGTVLVKNLAGSIAKIAVLFLFAALGSSGLLTAYGAGMVVALVLATIALGRTLHGGMVASVPFRAVRRHLSATASNYLATVMGILPISVVPIEVLAIRGPAQTAHFAIAFLLAGFLNFIPGTTSQVLFAEVSRGGATLGKQLRKALRWIYSLLLPAALVIVAAAPLVLRIFGTGYVTAATGPLRVLALSALVSAGNYLVDAMLISRDRSAAYVFMNGLNAALVLVCVAALLPHGLTAGASGWALAQGLSLAIGLGVLATGRTGRHHLPASSQRAVNPSFADSPVARTTGVDSHGVESELRTLLAAWPTMPTAMIAEQLGWDRPMRSLLDQVTGLRADYLTVGSVEARSQPGELAQCGFWFPPVEIPTGFGQVRSAAQLPVLTVINGYSRWLSAVLIPTTAPEDLIAGWLRVFEEVGGVPRLLIWNDEHPIGGHPPGGIDVVGASQAVLGALGTQVIANGPNSLGAKSLTGRAHAYMERSFLAYRTFRSPADFNSQLAQWIREANTKPRRSPHRSPAADIAADRQAMLSLPLPPPNTGWHISASLSENNYVHFDTNHYSVSPMAVGRLVEVLADLERVWVLCEGRIVADHERAWGTGQIVTDPEHAVGRARTMTSPSHADNAERGSWDRPE